MNKDMMKVMCPIEKDGKTFWLKLGVAFPNRDGSTNLYLDALPTNGRLQLRQMDERDFKHTNTNANTNTEPSGDLPF